MAGVHRWGSTRRAQWALRARAYVYRSKRSAGGAGGSTDLGIGTVEWKVTFLISDLRLAMKFGLEPKSLHRINHKSKIKQKTPPQWKG